MLEIIRLEHESPDFRHCFEIRLAVFVAEQNVAIEQENDGQDAAALHFLARLDGAPVGTARVLRKPEDCYKITRVAVLRQARGQNLGTALMRHIEAAVPARWFLLDAQIHARNFYERLGYGAQGDEFLEAGIPHVHMRKMMTAA